MKKLFRDWPISEQLPRLVSDSSVHTTLSCNLRLLWSNSIDLESGTDRDETATPDNINPPAVFFEYCEFPHDVGLEVKLSWILSLSVTLI